jgi:hypothetical protein
MDNTPIVFIWNSSFICRDSRRERAQTINDMLALLVGEGEPRKALNSMCFDTLEPKAKPKAPCSTSLRYILFMVKLPDPAHPDVTPVKVQVPETMLLLTVPCRVSRLPLMVVPDCTVI